MFEKNGFIALDQDAIGEDDLMAIALENGADDFAEPMFAILNFAKINDAPMEGEWVMEVDWVRHESLQ